jgi:hypothetical protein
MRWLAWAVLVAGAYPLGRAWWANRRTTLLQALHWALGAWAAWAALGAGELLAPDRDWAAPRYLALCLTGCAAVAVLGARRPGAAAWNFVVLGLLAVFLLPVAEGWGRPRLGWANTAFLAGTLAVGVLNYLPTRMGLAALLALTGCAVEVLKVVPATAERWADSPAGAMLLALVPWTGLAQLRLSDPPAAAFDQAWLDFRDRFGLVWGQRLREQFNRAAANAGWPVYLRWGGLRLRPGQALPGPAVQRELLTTLRALLKRFGPESAGEAG